MMSTDGDMTAAAPTCLPNGGGEAYSMDAPSGHPAPRRSFRKTHELWRAGGWWMVRERRRNVGQARSRSQRMT
jgi:hypothetical protein